MPRQRIVAGERLSKDFATKARTIV